MKQDFEEWYKQFKDMFYGMCPVGKEDAKNEYYDKGISPVQAARIFDEEIADQDSIDRYNVSVCQAREDAHYQAIEMARFEEEQQDEIAEEELENLIFMCVSKECSDSKIYMINVDHIIHDPNAFIGFLKEHAFTIKEMYRDEDLTEEECMQWVKKDERDRYYHYSQNEYICLSPISSLYTARKIINHPSFVVLFSK